MSYYKDENGKAYYKPNLTRRKDLIAITKQEADELLSTINTHPPLTTEQQRQEAMQTGVEFEGVMCSAFKEDQWGLDSVKDYIKDGMDIGEFVFKNGNSLSITQSNIDAFEAVWLPFRIAHTKSNFTGS